MVDTSKMGLQYNIAFWLYPNMHNVVREYRDLHDIVRGIGSDLIAENVLQRINDLDVHIQRAHTNALKHNKYII